MTVTPLTRTIPITTRLRAYWTLIKSLQTGLLLVTGLAGYASVRPTASGQAWLAMAGSLFLTISGSTVLNMMIDRDIDGLMKRTASRPLPSGTLGMNEAFCIGLALTSLGASWALALKPLYGLAVSAGVFVDVGVYTLWLKRRTPWSIVWGGVAGGMPILAGRVLGAGQIDLAGLLLALAVLLWIPTHMMTFGIKYAEDYARAGVPVFPNVYGERVSRLMIAVSTAGAVVVMLAAMRLTGLATQTLYTAGGLGAMLMVFAVASVAHRSPRLNFMLYKLASLYMLGSMLLIMAG